MIRGIIALLSLVSAQLVSTSTDTSNVWVLDGKIHYFLEPIEGVSAAKAAVQRGDDVTKTEGNSHYNGDSYFSVELPQLKGSARKTHYSPDSTYEFVQWFKNTWHAYRGNLWQSPGACWWYNSKGGSSALSEKQCIGRHCNSAVIKGDKGGLTSCPLNSHACYIYEGEASDQDSGSIWSVSAWKSLAQANAYNCADFPVDVSYSLDC